MARLDERGDVIVEYVILHGTSLIEARRAPSPLSPAFCVAQCGSTLSRAGSPALVFGSHLGRSHVGRSLVQGYARLRRQQRWSSGKGEEEHTKKMVMCF